MRKITEQTTAAFYGGRNLTMSNTRVRTDFDSDTQQNVSTIELYNTIIARYFHRDGKLCIQNGGFFTNTTKERLNGLKDVSIRQIKGKWYLNESDVAWDGRWTELYNHYALLGNERE